MKDCRKVFTEELLKLARADQSIFALATDSRGSATLNGFAAELPGQFVECGIAEQDAVGIAAGLAVGGMRPFVCGPACFLSLRSGEQVKVDVAYSRSNVKIIGVSGGVSYGALGGTHHAIQDIALMRTFHGLEVLLPADGRQMAAMTGYLAGSASPAYVRMGRGDVPDVYESGSCFAVGKANVLREGGTAAIIACGEMVWPALQAAEMLGDIMVVDMHTVSPLDIEIVLRAADTRLVVTVEEHSVRGGLGGAVAEALSVLRPTMMRIMGFPDEELYNGPAQAVKDRYGLNPAGITETVRAAR